MCSGLPSNFQREEADTYRTLALTLTLTIFLAASIISAACSAQTAPKPNIPEFTVQYADHSYDMPPTAYSTTDPYTNKTSTTTYPSYRVENFTIDLTIKNQPYPPTIEGNTSYLLYDVRTKGHYAPSWEKSWRELNSAAEIPHQTSGEYTVISLPNNYKPSDEVDFQIRAFLAYGYNFSIGNPFPMYSYDYINVAVSDWSSTQTVNIPQKATPTPTPVPPNAPLEIPTNTLLAVIAVLLVVIITLQLWSVLKSRSARKHCVKLY